MTTRRCTTCGRDCMSTLEAIPGVRWIHTCSDCGRTLAVKEGESPAYGKLRDVTKPVHREDGQGYRSCTPDGDCDIPGCRVCSVQKGRGAATTRCSVCGTDFKGSQCDGCGQCTVMQKGAE